MQWSDVGSNRWQNRAWSPDADAIRLMREALAFTAGFEGDIPGASAVECGNWQDHDLAGARAWAAAMLPVLEGYTEQQLTYPE